VVIDT